MVDVMLVCSSFFMVTAPADSAGREVNLPETKARSSGVQRQEIVLSVGARQTRASRSGEKKVYIGETEVKLEELEEKLKSQTPRRRPIKKFTCTPIAIFPYGIVVEVMAAAQRAGIDKVGMITEPIGTGGKNSAERSPHRGGSLLAVRPSRPWVAFSFLIVFHASLVGAGMIANALIAGRASISIRNRYRFSRAPGKKSATKSCCPEKKSRPLLRPIPAIPIPAPKCAAAARS